MNLATVIVALVLVLVCALIVRSMIKDKKAGRSSCGGDCSHCGSACTAAKPNK